MLHLQPRKLRFVDKRGTPYKPENNVHQCVVTYNEEVDVRRYTYTQEKHVHQYAWYTCKPETCSSIHVLYLQLRRKYCHQYTSCTCKPENVVRWTCHVMTMWAFVITFCPMCVRASVRKQFLQTTSSPKPLIGIWPNFTGMILGWSSFKVVQMIPVHFISRSQGLKIDFLTKKKTSCQKPLDRFQYNFAEMLLWWSSIKIVQVIWIRQK